MFMKKAYILKTALFFCFIFFLNLNANSQSEVVINEIQSMNGNSILDEDGDNEDWIELKNISPSTVNLFGWGLSDNDNAFKWIFPKALLKSGQRMLIFASGKDRRVYVHHWESAIKAEDTWKYYVNPNGVSATWKGANFDDTPWASGIGGFGFGDADDNTTVATNAPWPISIYLRKKFTVDTSLISSAIFSIDYDDGFIAYINGVQIARANMASTNPTWNEGSITDNEAKMYQGMQPTHFVLTKEFLKTVLLPYPAQNVLAVEVHNLSTTSSDMTAMPYLTFGIDRDTTLYQGVSLPVWFEILPYSFHSNFKIENQGENITLTKPGSPAIQQDYINSGVQIYNSSLSRYPDGSNQWKITYPATPNKVNDLSSIYYGYTSTPIISLPSGYYNSPQTVTITPALAQPNTTIRYTTNGNIPKITDNVYTGPITINSTTVLKARVFSTDGILFPCGVAHTTYIFNKTTKLPIISITIDSLDLWDPYTGIYVRGLNGNSIYPFKNANFWKNWERSTHVEFIDTIGIQRFSTDGMIGIFGNYTRAKPQKSFDFKVRALYDSAGINYKIFKNKDKTDFKNLVFRNAGSDWMKAHCRDEFLHEVLFDANIDCTPRLAVTAYLNGKYWGVYQIREKSDEKFLSYMYNYDKDSIDQIRTSGSDFAANGNMNAFNAMTDYFSGANLTSTANYNIAKQYWDIDNFMAYFVSEIYSGNDDWISTWINNIKLWRPRYPGAKWRYQLHDVDQGLLSDKLIQNTLDTVLYTTVTNNHSMMLNKFLQNADFKRGFINKFMDMFNTSLNADTMLKTLNIFKNEIQNEINYMVTQWPLDTGMQNSVTNTSYSRWSTNVTEIQNFINQRYKKLRTFLINKYNLGTDTIWVTIRSAQPERGKVKLNSLPPMTQKWGGVYLKGNPLDVTAIAEPGYVFDYWANSISFSNNKNMSLTQTFVNNDSLVAYFKIAPTITFSEINYMSDPTKDSRDWIELQNYGTNPLSISKWKLKQVSTGTTYTFPSGITLNPGSFLVLSQDTNFFRMQFPNVSNRLGPTNINFNDEGEEIQLLDSTNNVMIRFIYADTATWPDCAKGYGRTMQIIDPSGNINLGANWTCGCMGGSPGQAVSDCPESVIFSEVNYNSSSLITENPEDWVELYNRSDTNVNLSGWILKDGMDLNSYIIPQGTILKPHQYLVLFSDLQFNNIFGTYTHIQKTGPFNFKFNGDKEVIRLYNSTGKIYNSMFYKDKTPWPDSANGKGYTLELKNPNLNPTSPFSWFTGCKLGSPGSAYVYPCDLFKVDENSKTTVFKVFPNPANDNINIEFSNPENVESNYIEIFDIQGRLIISQNLFSDKYNKVNISHLQKGMYIYKLSNSNKNTIGSGKLFKY